jgi:hypothetical protein
MEEANSLANSLLDSYSSTAKTLQSENKRSGADPNQMDEADEDKWIHRDKLAKIESEELRAAGFVVTKSRSHSRPRRERSADKLNGYHRRTTDASDAQSQPRSRKNSVQTFTEEEIPSWDLRLPEEIAEDPGEYWVKPDNSSSKGSRLPVAKISPAPIPPDYLERDAPVPRKTSGSIAPEEDPVITKVKSQARGRKDTASEEGLKSQSAKASNTDDSPKKASNGNRKPSTRTASTTRPKTRSGSKTEHGGGSAARPTTRSGELSPTSRAAPEGDPPWMISSYKPDPRLPPDQQLLPTVARRLQQEQWEREGKFGNIYDKDFRPLNDEGYLKPPELQKPQAPEVEEKQDEWPLRAEAKSPTPSRPGTSSYSTMPKIQDTPLKSPMASPLMPSGQPHPTQITRIPDPPEPQEAKAGCGCCTIM